MLPLSRWLEPMLINLDLDRVAGRALVIGPELALAKAHAIKRLRRRARPVVGELFGIGESAAEPLDLASLTADVPGRADMARRIGAAHGDARAGCKARRHAHSAPWRAATSAILRPSSSLVTTPRWRSVLAIDVTQRS